MDQQALIQAVTETLKREPTLHGLFLAGSFGRGTADDWSDVDLIALVAPAEQAEFAAEWRSRLHAITPIVFWNELNRGGLIINAISEDWLRCDLSITAPDSLGHRAKDTVKPLIDPHGIYATLPDSLPLRQPDRGSVHYLIHEFIRMLGLLPVALGRGEYMTMVLGVGMLRGHVESLLMQEVSHPDPGGMLHQSKVLPAEQLEMLKALPYPGLDREALIAANFAMAQAFFPRARALAERLGLEWPSAFEAATRRRLEATIGRVWD